MRNRIILALCVGLASASVVAAQTNSTKRVIAKDTDVRSGPGLNFYPTSKLKAGNEILVIRALTDQPGWLEIVPPEGSFSWVNAKFLTQSAKEPNLWAVKAGSLAPLTTGSRVPGTGRPNHETMQLSGGTIVVALGPKADLDGESWLPIKPHSGETRYILGTDVQDNTTAAKVVSPANWILTPQNMYTTNPVLAEALKREAANDRAGAVQYYQQVVNNPNSDGNSRRLAQEGMARLQQPNYSPVQGTTTSLSPGNAAANAAIKLETWKSPEWSPYGRLYETKMTTMDGQPLYQLLDTRDTLLTYVSTAQGKSLQSYLGRYITVYGPTMHRVDSDSKMAYVVVTHVGVP